MGTRSKCWKKSGNYKGKNGAPNRYKSGFYLNLE